MEDFISCNICAHEFDSLHFIPKILKCGHTFCSPCLIKLLQENPFCPNCRIQLKEIESSLPVNYTALKAVDFYNSKCSAEKVVDIAAEVAKRKDIILKRKTQMTKVLDKCLEKLEELTVSQSERIDTVNARKILDEIDEDLKKTDDVVRSDDITSSISILLSSFEDLKQFLLEIKKRLQNGEKIFAVHKINEEFKYGEVSFFSKQLFFHSLSLSKAPKDSSLIWFEDVKQCLNCVKFLTFIKISCNEKYLCPFVIIEMFDKCSCSKFIKLCTGEFGPSYKGSLFKRGQNYSINKYSANLHNVLRVHKRIENKSENLRLMDYNLCLQKRESISFNANEMLLYLDKDCDFEIVRPSSNFNGDWTPPFGRVISPLTLDKDIDYGNPSNLISDCGILMNL